MNSLDLIRMGLKNLFRRKMRTILTTLGIVIGTISIVVMVSLGLGMKQNVNDRMNKWGNMKIVQVRTENGGRYGGRMISSSSKSDDEEDANVKKKAKIENDDITLMKQIAGVEAVSPVYQTQVNMVAKKYVGQYIQVKGLTLEFMEKYDLEIDQGRLLAEDDKASFIFGKRVAYNFSDNDEGGGWWDMYDEETGELKPAKFQPMDYTSMKMSFDWSFGRKQQQRGRYGNEEQKRPVRPISIKVVGVSGSENYDKSEYAYMEINALMKLRDKYDKMTGYQEYGGKKPKKGFDQAMLYVPNRKHVDNVLKEVRKLGFEASSDTEFIKETESMNNMIQMIFGGIGGVALLVAAIGITNTMVMAIYERRKEIGVMKVIGASLRDIKKLFLFESASIGLFGGIFGVGISVGLSYLINSIADGNQNLGRMFGSYGETDVTISVVPPWLILLSLVFTSVIGLVSGYLPARKAMKLSALEAIKTD